MVLKCVLEKGHEKPLGASEVHTDSMFANDQFRVRIEARVPKSIPVHCTMKSDFWGICIDLIVSGLVFSQWIESGSSTWL